MKSIKKTKTLVGVLQNVSLLIASLIAALLLAELCIRFVPNEAINRILSQQAVRKEIDEVHPKGLYTMETPTFWTLTPHFEGRFQKPGIFDIQVHANKDGIRNEEVLIKPPGTFRILGLGDSFAFGWGVEGSENYLKILEKRLNEIVQSLSANESPDNSEQTKSPVRQFEVVNAGVPGYGTYEAFQMLRTLEPSYNPDLVILSFYEGNDYRNNGDAPRHRIIKDGYLSDVSKTKTSGYENFLKKHSVMASLLWSKIENIEDKTNFKAHVDKTKKLLIEMQEWLDERDIPFVFVFIPDQEAGFYNRATLLRIYDRLLMGMDIKEARASLELFCRKKGIYYYSLSSLFENNIMAQDFRLKDTHLNPKGHSLAAEEILSFLDLNGLIFNEYAN